MILDDNFHEEHEIHLSDQGIFTQIWTKPRRIFRYLHDKSYDKFVTPLLVLAGLINALNQAINNKLGEEIPLFGILGLCLLIGGLLGWIGYYLYAALIRWTGNWLNGESNLTEIVRVLAYSSTPSLLILLLWIPQLLIFGNEMFQFAINTERLGAFSNIFFYTIAAAEVVLGLWSIWLTVIGISEIQNFGNGKALINLILPILIVVIPFILLFLLMDGLA